MIKFGFKIKTRDGMVIENLMVIARDRAEHEDYYDRHTDFNPFSLKT